MSAADRSQHFVARSTVIGSVLIGLALGATQGGCVQRRMTVRTNPPGAMLYVDDYEVGTTPVSTNFTYYGKRKIRLVKDGYETLTVTQPIPAPWYEYPPIDFVAENLVPGEIRDQRVLDYQLKPQAVVPTEQLLSRAQQLRGNVHAAGGIVPAGGVPMPTGGTGAPSGQAVGGQLVPPLP